MKMDLDKCRLCLNEGVLTSVFQKQGDLMLSAKIMSLAKVEVHVDDGLPDQICLDCLMKLNSCFDFIQQCERSDLYLRSMIVKIKSDISDICPEKNDYLDTEDRKDIRGHTENIFDDEFATETVILKESVSVEKEINKSNFFVRSEKPRKAQKEQCSTCGKVLSSKFRLKMHLRIHTGEKPFSCPHCDKRFSLSQNLKVHLRIHTGEKPLECTICGVSFAHSAGLLAHKRKHSGQMPYLCTLCPRSFRTIGHLQYHVRRHTGEASFECDMCTRAFITRSELKQHVLSHTGEKPHVCCACGSGFARASNLRRHVKHQHHGEKPYACNKCTSKFAQKSDFERHKKKHEKDK